MTHEQEEEDMLRDVASTVTLIARRRSVQQHQVDDFVQEGLIGASQAYRRYSQRFRGATLRKLMVSSANNRMYDWQRKIVRFSRVAGVAEIPDTGYNTDFLRDSSVMESLRRCLDGIDPGGRAIIECWVRSEASLNNEEISRIVGVSRSTVSRTMQAWRDSIKHLVEFD